MGRILVVTLLMALAACDSRAQPSSAAAASPLPDRLGREHESCASTSDCAEGLRCFELTCRRIDRSLLGDYHAALGALRREAGDLEGALSAYAKALSRYGADKLAPPVDVECAYGMALASGRADKERAELAARVLHRCVAGAPAGSELRNTALRAVAVLDEAGLDPEHLGREGPADVYLSRSPSRPKSEDLEIAVSASPEPTAKSWPAALEAMRGTRSALVACWEANYDATKKPALTVNVPMQSKYRPSEYDDEPGVWTTGVDPKAAPPASEAERCVRDAVGAAVKGVKGGGEWAATVTISVK